MAEINLKRENNGLWSFNFEVSGVGHLKGQMKVNPSDDISAERTQVFGRLKQLAKELDKAIEEKSDA